ncbi:MAG: hypothetical protein M1830_005775 [Pleopsidium flavum]|nr:MAG: hypothetical protein M1830_005775 [Pleopsidium flavum]
MRASLSSSHIEACHTTLQKIRDRLDKRDAPASEKPILKIKHHLHWPLSKSETSELLSEVERHKSTFSLRLTVDEMHDLLHALEQQDLLINSVAELQADANRKRMEDKERQLDKRRRRILESFDTLKPWETHESVRKLPHPRTGTSLKARLSGYG